VVLFTRVGQHRDTVADAGVEPGVVRNSRAGDARRSKCQSSPNSARSVVADLRQKRNCACSNHLHGISTSKSCADRMRRLAPLMVWNLPRYGRRAQSS
jgi:hypothetical protein